MALIVSDCLGLIYSHCRLHTTEYTKDGTILRTFCKQSEARPDYPDRPYCNLALDVAHSFHKPLPDELLDLATRIKLQLQVQVQAC